jgi:hypothetical protein
MRAFPSIERRLSQMNPIRLGSSLLRCAALLLVLAFPPGALAAAQDTFPTPEAAVDALLAALKADDEAAFDALFGKDYRAMVSQPDRAATRAVNAKILAAMTAYRVLREPSADRRILVIGAEAWPLPIPLVRIDNRWRFASEEGVDEIINRRIGANERYAMRVLRAYLDAQRAYATIDRDGDGVLQYARRLASTPGKRDGLYWPADAAKGEEQSPFGPLVAESAGGIEGRGTGAPYRGYHYRILTRQGPGAPGGAYNYVINGRMIAGFAMVAYPAVYGQTGVMSFIVSHNGRIYERDLGKDSTAIGARMSAFDPGTGWKAVAP